jgi:hypothetical protein
LVLRHVAGDFFALDNHNSDHHPKTQETQDDEQSKDDSDTA